MSWCTWTEREQAAAHEQARQEGLSKGVNKGQLQLLLSRRGLGQRRHDPRTQLALSDMRNQGHMNEADPTPAHSHGDSDRNAGRW
jgi:hypothetical protein